MDGSLTPLFYVLIFPGFVFLVAAGFLAEFFDRKVYARLQNRQGPPWFQPFADIVKLLAKEDIVTDHADRFRDFISEVPEYIRDGRVKYRESVTHGLANAPSALAQSAIVRVTRWTNCLIECSRLSEPASP